MSARSRVGASSGRDDGDAQSGSAACKGDGGGGGHAVCDRHPSVTKKVVAPPLRPPLAGSTPTAPATAAATTSFSTQRLKIRDYDLFAAATCVRARLHLRRWRARERAAGRKPQLDMIGEVAALEIACRECGDIDLRRWLAPRLSSRTLAMLDRAKRRMPTAADGTEPR